MNHLENPFRKPPKNPESSNGGGDGGGRKARRSGKKLQEGEAFWQAMTNFVFSQHSKLKVRGRLWENQGDTVKAECTGTKLFSFNMSIRIVEGRKDP